MRGDVLSERIKVLPRGHTVVAHQRECDDQNLAAVRRVSYRLGIAHHTSLENQFSCNTLLRTKAPAEADVAILKLKSQVLALIGTWGHDL